MGTKRRILHGIGASGFGQIVTLLIQLASVPILISAWGIELYGEWIMLSAIPTYLVLSDIGLSFVAGNSLALISEKGDIRQMQTIYQSTWVMVTSLSLIVLIPVVVFVWVAEPGHFLGLKLITDMSLKAVLLLLFTHVALCMQTGILRMPFRVMKRHPFSIVALNTIRLLEWVMATVVALTGGGVVKVAGAFLLIRLLGNFCLWLVLKKSGSFLKFGIRYASLHTIRTLLRPSLAAMGITLGLSFTMQGFILLVGSMVGSVGVAVFSIYRTFTRVPIQFATALNQAIWPELSYAFGANDISKAKRLVTRMLQFGASLSVMSVMAVYYLGETVIDLWVSKAFEHNTNLLIVLSLAASIHILWKPFWDALMAINKHTRFASFFLAISGLTLVLGWLLLLEFKLVGAGYAIIAYECLLAVAAFFSYKSHFKLAGDN